MFRNLFGSAPSRPQRPTFRPHLETLESREVPTCAQVSAAFNQLPAAVATLQASITAHDVNGINVNLGPVVNDMFLMRSGAPGFTVGDRERIDGALVANGLRIAFTDFRALSFIPMPQFENVLNVGVSAIQQGVQDFLFTSFFPASSGDCTLT